MRHQVGNRQDSPTLSGARRRVARACRARRAKSAPRGFGGRTLCPNHTLVLRKGK